MKGSSDDDQGGQDTVEENPLSSSSFNRLRECRGEKGERVQAGLTQKEQASGRRSIRGT